MRAGYTKKQNVAPPGVKTAGGGEKNRITMWPVCASLLYGNHGGQGPTRKEGGQRAKKGRRGTVLH